MPSKLITGIFACTRDINVSRTLPHSTNIPIRLRTIEVANGVPAINEKREQAFICCIMERNSEALFEREDEVFYWEISGLDELDITEKGIAYTEALFQAEEYTKALILLEKEFDRQKVGFRFWKISKVWRFLAETKYCIGVIENEMLHSEAGVTSGKQERIADIVVGLRKELKNAKVKSERKRGNLESQSHNIRFFNFIFGTLFGLFLSILLKFVD
jgi:hypothetical protein